MKAAHPRDQTRLPRTRGLPTHSSASLPGLQKYLANARTPCIEAPQGPVHQCLDKSTVSPPLQRASRARAFATSNLGLATAAGGEQRSPVARA